jgi:PEP-CTERM motif
MEFVRKRIWATALPAVLSAAALFGLGAAQPAAAGLVINPTYDAAVPVAARTAIQNVINEYQTDFSNNVTVNLTFQWDTLNGSALTSGAATAFSSSDFLSPFGGTAGFSLGAVKALYATAAAASGATAVLQTANANLPASYPNAGCCGGTSPTKFFIPDAEYKALTGTTLDAGDTVDAFVGFANDFCGTGALNCAYNFTAGNPGANKVDFTAVAEHEISHALSRVDFGFSSGVKGTSPPFLTPQDFFKYASCPGALDPKFDTTCFSFDGGATNPGGKSFSDLSDSGDWSSCAEGTACPSVGDSFDAFIAPSETSSVSTADIKLMCAEGWNDQSVCGAGTSAPVPEPASMALFGSALAGLAALRRRRNRQVQA